MTEFRSDTRPVQINQKDASQDQEIALLKHRLEDSEKLSEELRDRVRKLERWVWGAGAVISAAITIIGIAIAADARPAHALVEGSLTGEPCATHEVASVAVQEVSIKPEEKE
jgi:hypothetical protein